MNQATDTLIEIRVDADVGAARRYVRGLAAGWGIGEQTSEPACIAVTELGTNILRHGGGQGHVLVRPLGDPEHPALEMLAVDRGPGIAQIAVAPPGTPNGSGLGVGLGGVGRLADVVDTDTTRAAGTVVLARFFFDGRPRGGWLRWGGVSVPLLPHDGNGDAWAVTSDDRYATVLVVDGLGHGRHAKQAADAALVAFEAHNGDTLAWIERAHQAMRSTRGGVLAVARIDRSRRVVQFVGVGNISGRIIGPDRARGLASTPGTIGTALPTPRARPVEEPWAPGSTLVMWSDGIRSGVDLGDRPRLLGRDPAVIAAVVHRDFRRDNDDATVVVVQDAGG